MEGVVFFNGMEVSAASLILTYGDMLNYMPKGDSKNIVQINSNGGDISTSIRIIEEMRKNIGKRKVEIIIDIKPTTK